MLQAKLKIRYILCFIFLETSHIISEVIQIKGYKHDTVKIIFDWFQGYDVILNNCHNMPILTEMLLFCDYYDIPRPVSPIIEQMVNVSIRDDTLITTMQCVFQIEEVETYKYIAKNLERKCVQFVENRYRSAKALGMAVVNNFANIDIIYRLLAKCSNLNTGDSSCSFRNSAKMCPKCNSVIGIDHCSKFPIAISDAMKNGKLHCGNCCASHKIERLRANSTNRNYY